MSRLSSRIMVIALIVTGMGGISFLGYQYYQTCKVRDLLNSGLEKANRKIENMEQKYAEQKALNENLLRLKASLEGKIRGGEQEQARLEREIQIREAQKRELREEAKLQENIIDSYELRVSSLLEDHQSFKDEIQRSEENLARTEANHKSVVGRYVLENKKLQTTIDEKEQQFNRCANDNSELLRIADELILAYEDKSLLASLVEKEPLTQLGRVSLEQFVQEYREKIEKEKVEIESE
ncbi:MAG: hypothetical protein U9O82_11045 [Thermodesulfobacteriota bacterium]|nr:hypothetical protein [Thermodesulfobacteriota bacterium]